MIKSIKDVLEEAYSGVNKYNTWVALGKPSAEPTKAELLAHWLCDKELEVPKDLPVEIKKT